MINITKDFTFDAAHRLVRDYKGKCKNVHGHTYKVFITVGLRVVPDPQPELDEYGFVEDFDKLKVIKNWVDENWDHASIVNSEDREWLEWLVSNEQKHYIMYLGNGNPTVEHMCKELFGVCKKHLSNERVFVSEVKIYETPTSCASYTESN